MMKKVIVADDHVVLREALCEHLQLNGGFEVIGQASDGKELIELLQNNNDNPDIIILDLIMPKIDGLRVLERMAKEGKDLPPVLVLSADEGKENIKNVLNAGAKGYLPKNATLEELKFAISYVLKGKTYLSPSISASVLSEETQEDQDPLECLSKREKEVFKLLAEGYKNRDIAKMLNISIRTVDSHRMNILKKLDLTTNAELVKLAISCGMISI